MSTTSNNVAKQSADFWQHCAIRTELSIDADAKS
jgi:hypothetical protein